MSERNDLTFDDSLDTFFQGTADVDPGAEFERAVLVKIRSSEVRRRRCLSIATVAGAVIAMMSVLPLANMLLDWLSATPAVSIDFGRFDSSATLAWLAGAVACAIIGCLALNLDDI